MPWSPTWRCGWSSSTGRRSATSLPRPSPAGIPRRLPGASSSRSDVTCSSSASMGRWWVASSAWRFTPSITSGIETPMRRCIVLTLLLTAAPIALLRAQSTPLQAFRDNIAAIHARDRAAYLSHYLHTPALARVGPDGLRLGYEDFAKGRDAGWPDTLVATHFQIVPVSPDVAYGVYRYRVVDSSGSARGVSERVFLRTPAGWKVAVTTAFPTPNVAPPATALLGATLVDPAAAGPVRGAVIVLRDGRIACAGSRAACPVPADADTVNAAGKWIIPGLIDTHVHFSQTGWVDGRPDALDLRDRYPYETVEAELHARPERFFRSYLCSGVTSVFDVGGYPWTLDLQARTARSTTAPRVRAAGSLLSTIDFWLNLPDQRQFSYLADEAVVRRAVRAHKTWGAAAIKVWYIMPPQPPDTARISALVRAAGDEARKVGLPLIVHATGLWEAKDALRAGARVLLHSVWAAPVDDEFLALARSQGTTYVPTLTGPDGGNPLTLHGVSVFMELEAMQASGLTPRDVLVAATANPARALGLDSTGTVVAGATADLVVLDADPLADIRNVRQIALVVRRGELYTRHELEY